MTRKRQIDGEEVNENDKRTIFFDTLLLLPYNEDNIPHGRFLWY